MTTPHPLNPLAFPLHGARLIEASAGTGKTWTIAALYVRLVLGHGGAAGFGRALLPPEILVVTFTEAATQELRDRIRRRLAEAARCFRGRGDPDGFLRGLMAAYPQEQLPLCARVLEVAADWMDEAAVYTIHGWCKRMLRQHAFDSGSLFDLELDSDDAELLHEAVRDYWRSFFYPLDAVASQAVSRLAASPEALLGKFQGLLQESEAGWRLGDAPLDTAVAAPESLLAQWRAWEEQRRAWENQARQVWAGQRPAIEAMLQTASEQGWLNGTSYRKDSFPQRLQALADWAERGAPCEDKWLAGFGQSRFKMNGKHQDKTPRHPAFLALDALADHLEQEPDDYPAKILAHAVHWVRARYAAEKQRRARMDFGDLLSHLDQALRGPSGARLAAAIRRQYPVALIDEFQDTDPVQYRIFAAVYPEQESPLTPTLSQGERGPENATGLFMIGDPKQAIYSFRGADIHTYLQARQATQGRHYTLGRNFRSTVPLVAALNRLFQYAEEQPGGAFLFKKDGATPLPFYPVEAQGRAERLLIDGRPAAAMTLWHQAVDAPLSLGEYRRSQAEAAAGEILRCLALAAEGRAGFQNGEGFQPLQPADIAILVRDRQEAAVIRQALEARRLRSVYLSDKDSVFAGAEARDLLYWLQACAEPEQDRHLRAALASATLDLPYTELDRLNHDELRWEAEVERFRGYRNIWRYQGVLPMLRRLLADFHLPARWLQQAGGERRLTNVLHLAELLQSASQTLDGERALIRHLAEAMAETGPTPDGALLRLESDAELIKVVTIHKSKGLEYPLVFLPFACGFKAVEGKNRVYFRFHDADGRLLVDLGKSEPARLAADQERLREDLRLLYVALTRPRHACWLGIAPLKVGNAKACQLHLSALGHVLAGKAPMEAAGLAPALAKLQGDCPDLAVAPPPEAPLQAYQPPGGALALAEARPYQARALERWWIASYSALALASPEDGAPPTLDAPDTPQAANLADRSDAPTEEPAYSGGGMHRFPRGAGPGTFLHGLLEWAAREGFERVAADPALREDAIARRCQKRGWTHWIPALDAWLQRLLAAPLALPDGALALHKLDAAACRPELEFWFAAQTVDTLALDRLVSRHTFAGRPRPPLQAQQLNGMLKGFIDLVFEYQGRYYLADYKSNWLGADAGAYSAAAMDAAMRENRYDLQYCLYLLALHRQLQSRLGAAYNYQQHMGGAVYLFLRGLDGPAGGVRADKPELALIEELDALFSGRNAPPPGSAGVPPALRPGWPHSSGRQDAGTSRESSAYGRTVQAGRLRSLGA